jgi:hypothetical protein
MVNDNGGKMGLFIHSPDVKGVIKVNRNRAGTLFHLSRFNTSEAVIFRKLHPLRNG